MCEIMCLIQNFLIYLIYFTGNSVAVTNILVLSVTENLKFLRSIRTRNFPWLYLFYVFSLHEKWWY